MARCNKRASLIFILTLLVCNKTFSQTKDIALQESRCIKLYSALTSFIREDHDSVSFYSNKFENVFTSLIQNNPATLQYSFKRLTDSNFCRINTSDDGNLRIYSWDTWTGGTMHIFRNIYQWKANGKVFTRIVKYGEGDAGNFCSKIFTVNITNKPYYLAITNGIFSTRDAIQSISAYTINNSKLADAVGLFRTKTKKLHTIDVSFDFFSVVDRPERPLELITYDNKQKIVYIPVVDNKGQVTTKNILYQLKGDHFEFTGIKTGTRK